MKSDISAYIARGELVKKLKQVAKVLRVAKEVRPNGGRIKFIRSGYS